MRKLYVVFLAIFSVNIYAQALNCNVYEAQRVIAEYKALGITDQSHQNMVKKADVLVAADVKVCQECAKKDGKGWEFGESGDKAVCECVGVLRGNTCDKCEGSKKSL